MTFFWNCLPEEVQRRVIKRLDLRNRFRFRHVSKTCQQLVDTVPLFIPRIVLKTKSKKEAKLTFYLGIDRFIDVKFVANGMNNCIRVQETTFGRVVKHGADRIVPGDFSAMIACVVFREVAMNPMTLCGGVEFDSTEQPLGFSLSSLKMFFGNRFYRTKLLYLLGKNSPELLLRCSSGELEEIMEESFRFGRPCMAVYTDRLKIIGNPNNRVAWIQMNNKEEGNKTSTWVPPYVLKMNNSREATVCENEPGETRKKIIIDYLQVEECGLMSCDENLSVKDENYCGCVMRWACPKCGDPFENWYIKKKLTDFWWAGDFENKITAPMVEAYRELMNPCIKGQSNVETMMNGWRFHADMCRELIVNRWNIATAVEEEEPEVEVEEVEIVSEGIDKRWHLLMMASVIFMIFGVLIKWFWVE